MITRFGSGGPYEDVIGYSRVVRAGDWYLTAGCTATVGGELRGVGDAYVQAITAFGVGLDALERAGCPREQVVQTRMYLIDRADIEAVTRAHRELFGGIRPAATILVVGGFVDPRMLIEVELMASGAA